MFFKAAYNLRPYIWTRYNLRLSPALQGEFGAHGLVGWSGILLQLEFGEV